TLAQRALAATFPSSLMRSSPISCATSCRKRSRSTCRLSNSKFSKRLSSRNVKSSAASSEKCHEPATAAARIALELESDVIRERASAVATALVANTAPAQRRSAPTACREAAGPKFSSKRCPRPVRKTRTSNPEPNRKDLYHGQKRRPVPESGRPEGKTACCRDRGSADRGLQSRRPR